MTKPFGLFGKGGLQSQPWEYALREGTGVAKQRIRVASPGSRSLDTSSSEQGNGNNSVDIAALAYQLWQARGCPEGSPEVDWLEAEEQFRSRTDEVAAPQVSEPMLVRRSGA